MIDLNPLKDKLGGKSVAVVGLGKSGLSTIEACVKAGIDVIAWDDNPQARIKADALGATVREMTHAVMADCAFLVLAPGIPLTHPAPHPAAVLAKAARIDVVCDIEVFHRAYPFVKTIGITGTNGKSTTTALVGHILKTADVDCAVGGNIGEASLTLPTPDERQRRIYVFELSSYQLDLCTTYTPDISVMINLSPDHLDRHGGMDGYIAAKKRIFRGKGDAFIGVDDAYSARVLLDVREKGERNVTSVSTGLVENGIFVDKGGTIWHDGNRIAALSECPALSGRHNWQNAAFAYAACHAAGVPLDKIVKGLQTYPGLKHRQNIVATIDGVRYVNDSKATNDQSASMALATFDPVYWIAGGKSKGGGYKDCELHLGRVRHAFLIGEAADEMAAWLGEKNVPFTVSGTMAQAVASAHAMAQSEKKTGATVLLSPACASFDQFASFEARGDAFETLVGQLTQSPAPTQTLPKNGR